MSWLTKFINGSRKGKGKGKEKEKYDEEHDEIHVESDQDEDLNRAIALSLAQEQERKGKKVFVDEEPLSLENEDVDEDEDEQLARALQESMNMIDDPENSNTDNFYRSSENEDVDEDEDEDEQLARALQESMNMVEHPENSNTDNFYRSSQNRSYSKTRKKFCAGCKNRIRRERYLTCLNAHWHPQCFCCQACRQPISDREFTVAGHSPYHKSCSKNQNHPRCKVCKKYLPANSAGQVEYKTHPLWAEKYCLSHEHDRTSRCCSCQRLEPRDAKYIFLGAGDGRKLCLKCLDSAIMSNEECEPLILDIKEFFEGLNMRITQEFPILLVKRHDLNEAVQGEIDPSRPLSEVRGLCSSLERTVPSIRRRPRRSSNGFTNVETEPYRMERVSEVTGVMVIYGLPRLLTGSILAHELMHAWMRLNGYHDINLDIEEGICQVLGHMWLEAEIMAGSGGSSYLRRRPMKQKRSPFEKSLGEFFKYQIELDSSPVYGDGYKAANKAVSAYGLYETLKHIKRTGSLP